MQLQQQQFWQLKVIIMIAIPTLNDWVKNLMPIFQPMTSKPKTKTKTTLHMQYFPRLWASWHTMLGILIASLSPLLLLSVITLELIAQKSFENHSNKTKSTSSVN